MAETQDAIIADLIRTLEIYADPHHWEKQRQTFGHGESGDVLTWVGPPLDRGYFGPTKGHEYATGALTRAKAAWRKSTKNN